jgi:hypothetical protein
MVYHSKNKKIINSFYRLLNIKTIGDITDNETIKTS